MCWALGFMAFLFSFALAQEPSTSVPRRLEEMADPTGAAAAKDESDLPASVSGMGRVWENLSARGFTGQVGLTADWSKNLRGSVRRRGSAVRSLVRMSTALDVSKAVGWKGATAFASLYSYLGDNGRDYVGDAQGFSNIDSTSRTYLYELWFQQELFYQRLRVKTGKIDANTEFAAVDTARDFLNSSMGYSPTIVGFTTYPLPRPGLIAEYEFTPRVYGKAGVFDTAGPGVMPVIEAGTRWALTPKQLPGRLAGGFWRQSGPLERFDGDWDDGSNGFYFVAEQTLWRGGEQSQPADRPQASDTPSIALFWQFGTANGEVSSFTRHLGTGVSWRGPFSRRRNDAFGFGATWVRFSQQGSAPYDRPGEVAWEAFYKFRVNRLLTAGPDLQFIQSPGGLRSQRDCLLLTPRITIDF